MSFNKKKLKLVSLKHTMKKHIAVNDMKNSICDAVRSFPNYQELKQDVNLVKYVCNCIESTYVSSNDKEKIDKKQLVIDIFVCLFPELNNLDQINRIVSLITFLHDNKDIHNLGVSKVIWNQLSSIKKNLSGGEQ